MLENGSSMQNDLAKLEEQSGERRQRHDRALLSGQEMAGWGAALGKGVKAAPCAQMSQKGEKKSR